MFGHNKWCEWRRHEAIIVYSSLCVQVVRCLLYSIFCEEVNDSSFCCCRYWVWQSRSMTLSKHIDRHTTINYNHWTCALNSDSWCFRCSYSHKNRQHFQSILDKIQIAVVSKLSNYKIVYLGINARYHPHIDPFLRINRAPKRQIWRLSCLKKVSIHWRLERYRLR